MNRPDGRSSGGTLRPLACELSCLHQADGSALWKAGATHVLAAVHGPLAPRQSSKESSDGGIVSVLIKSGNNTPLEREWESFLTQVLAACVDVSQYPRSVLQVVLQIIQSDGSVLSCALQAAVASLMDAGIHMKSIPVATTCCLAQAGTSSLRLDPTLEEEQDGSVLVIVTSTDEPEKMLACQSMGSPMKLESLLTCLQAASKASLAVVSFLRLAIEQKVERQAKTLFSS